MLFKKGARIILLIFLGALIFASGFYLGESQKVFVDPSQDIDFTLFWGAYYKLKDNFPGFEEVEEEEIVHGAIRGMIESLNDPYTVFFDEEESKVFLDEVSGKFEGVGMEIGRQDNRIQVISPLEETPAERAGIRSGDIIKSIDGETTEGISLEEAVSRIRGPKGEPVILEVIRNDKQKEITIIRDVIQIPSVSWEIKEDNIAYIKLYYFHTGMSGEFAQTVQEIVYSPAEKIILDLRGNPGGSLDVVRIIAGWFMEDGDILVFGKNEAMEEEILISGNPIFLDYPTVVLINKGSASASEILAGALRDNRGTQVVGETSFGKGTIQSLHNLEDGSSLKITSSYWLTPGKTQIEEEGIVPDIKVEMTEEDYKEGRDPQLERAIEILINDQ